METKMCIEDFVRQVLTPAIKGLSSEEKRAFRQPWLDYIAEKERTKSTTDGFLNRLSGVRISPAPPEKSFQ